jgi:mannitol-1-phosphate 5-dehydrogenase
MGKCLIVGAGAIGRGYIPWELKDFDITFFDTNLTLVDSLASRKRYKSFMSYGDRLESLEVDSSRTFSSVNEIDLSIFDLAFICVGPRNVNKLSPDFGKLICPIYSLENDPATVMEMRKLFDKENIYFGVPDVITSLTASPESLSEDSNALHTENGILYLEDHGDIPISLKSLTPTILWIDPEKMRAEWDAKLYIHNTPHCIAAFLGYFHNCTYLHEALKIPDVAKILEGVVGEILQMLKVLTDHNHTFMEEYAKKEIRRFSNELLYDPVVRVAREPLRKLQPDGRLLGALRMAISAGIVPTNLAIGICSALKYDHPEDKDYEYMKRIDIIGVSTFLEYFLDVSPSSAESKLISLAHKEYDWKK